MIMKKKSLIGKILLSSLTFVAPFVVYSCGSATKTSYDNFDYSKIDFNTYNKWLDDEFNQTFTREFIDNLEKINYDYTFDSSIRSEYINNATIKGNIPENRYSLSVIKNDLFFVEGIDNNAQYIHNFLEAYMKWNNSNVLAYKNPHYSENTKSSNSKRALIYSEGGPFGTLPNSMITSSNFPSNWTYFNSKYQYGSNALPLFFNQPLYDFIPHKFLIGLPSSDLNSILSNIVDTNLRNKTLNYINNGTIKDYDTFRIMLGSFDLSSSQVFELVSESFAEISKLKRHALVENLISQNYAIYQMGLSYGYESIAQDVLLDNYILQNTEKFFLGRNYLNKFVKGSLRSSGGILTESMQEVATGNSTQISSIMFYSVGYYKLKYGLLNPYKELMKKNLNFTQGLQSKWIVRTGTTDFNVGRITPIEKDFYISNKINFAEFSGGHETPLDLSLIKSDFFGFSNTELDSLEAKYIYN